MALHQNENLCTITDKDLNSLRPTGVLYIDIPKVIKADIWWQHDCKTKLVLSKTALQAKNVADSVVLHSMLDSSQVIKTITVITIYNCSLHSNRLLTKLAQILSNIDNSKVFQSLELCNCSITDSDVQYLYEMFTENIKSKCIIVSCVNLSNNAITSSGVKTIINLLNSWKSEKLIITGNGLHFNGLQKLINATKNEINTLKVLDAQDNKIVYLDEENLSEKLFLDSTFSICYCILNPKTTVVSEPFNSVVIKQINVHNSAVQIDTIENTRQSMNYRDYLSLFTGSVKLLQKLALKRLSLVGPINITEQEILCDILEQSYSIQELHLYVSNMTDNVQLRIIKKLPKSCISMTILSTKSFKAKKSNCNYIKRGVQLTLLQTCYSLNDISLNNCEMDDETLNLLHEMVWNCKHDKMWKNIDLSNCALGDKLGLF